MGSCSKVKAHAVSVGNEDHLDNLKHVSIGRQCFVWLLVSCGGCIVRQLHAQSFDYAPDMTRLCVDSVTSKFVLCCISVQLGSTFVFFRFLLSLDGSMPVYQPYHHRGLLQLWKSSHEEAWYIRHKFSNEVKQVQLLDPYAVPGRYTDDGCFEFAIQDLGDIQMVDVFDILDDTVYCTGKDEKYLHVGSGELQTLQR